MPVDDALSTMEQKDFALSKLLKTEAGRVQIAQTMIEPIRSSRDYVAIGRKFIFVDRIPQGAPIWYDKDISIPAVIMSKRGTVPRTQVEGTRVDITNEVYAVASFPRIPILETAVRRFNILERTQIKARSQIAEQEDSQIFSAIETAATGTGANTVVNSTGGLNRTTLNQMFGQVEQQDVPVNAVLLHPLQYKDLRGWTTTEFDPVTQREVLKAGLLGNIWGADVYRSKQITSGRAYTAGDMEFLGALAVRVDLDYMDAPQPAENLELGFVFYEYIAISIVRCQERLKNRKVLMKTRLYAGNPVESGSTRKSDNLTSADNQQERLSKLRLVQNPQRPYAGLLLAA